MTSAPIPQRYGCVGIPLSSELIALAALQILSAVAIVATLKADIRWIKKWTRDHEQRDDDRFRETREDIREVREAQMLDARELTRRVAAAREER